MKIIIVKVHALQTYGTSTLNDTKSKRKKTLPQNKASANFTAVTQLKSNNFKAPPNGIKLA